MSYPTKHLYIHWPFCKRKCWYCDFTSFPEKESFIESYHSMLCEEIKQFANGQEIETIFFGGGTPSLYPLPLLENLFGILRSNFSLSRSKEITIEVNPYFAKASKGKPQSATEEKLEAWKNIGINRLSIGIQTLDENVLRSVNRYQSDESVMNLLDIAPKYFDNISVDIILGLPEVTEKIWQKTLNFIVERPISHVSVYFLTLYEKTPLAQKVAAKKIILPDESLIMKRFESTIDLLQNHGFEQYETSNFARPGMESLHNKAYWNRAPYRGFGLSAASFDGKKRFVNTHNLQQYVTSYEKERTEEVLSKSQAFLEELMLGLRQKTGVGLQRMVYFLSIAKQSTFRKKLENLKTQNLIREYDNHIFLTRRGVVLENEVIVQLTNDI